MDNRDRTEDFGEKEQSLLLDLADLLVQGICAYKSELTSAKVARMQQSTSFLKWFCLREDSSAATTNDSV